MPPAKLIDIGSILIYMVLGCVEISVSCCVIAVECKVEARLRGVEHDQVVSNMTNDSPRLPVPAFPYELTSLLLAVGAQCIPR